ncbi:MAG: response regulator [Gemmataceae bacterium]
MAESILIVDDEEPVRRTFQEWLERARIDCQILVASDAESALTLANRQPIDLAILDWNLGAGDDGLQLLQDLSIFHPDVVAILITGFANQATPLDAMRMGVRDYLDKNQDLNQQTFLNAVKRQLERIRPAKRERQLHQSLVAFREAVEKVLPLVRSAAALSDPVTLPEAIASLFRFLLHSTGAGDGVLLVRHYDVNRQPPETIRAYDSQGESLEGALVPFARSIAGSVAGLQEPCAMENLEQAISSSAVELQPFERGRRSLLAAPLAVAPGMNVVLELFDKHDPHSGQATSFTSQDRRLVAAAADFGAEMLRQALAERQTQQVLLDAVAAALQASQTVTESLGTSAEQRLEQPPPATVLDSIRANLTASAAPSVDPELTVRLAEAIRVLALRHGSRPVQHCLRLIEDLRHTLDDVTGVR